MAKNGMRRNVFYSADPTYAKEELVIEDVQTGAVFRSGGKSDGK